MFTCFESPLSKCKYNLFFGRNGSFLNPFETSPLRNTKFQLHYTTDNQYIEPLGLFCMFRPSTDVQWWGNQTPAYNTIAFTEIVVTARDNKTYLELSNHRQTSWLERRPEKTCRKKRTGNLGRNQAQAHETFLLGFMRTNKLSNNWDGVGLDWLTALTYHFTHNASMLKGPGP